jgi:hypothetical protein
MAQSRPAPAAGGVPDPGGPSFPLNGASTPAPLQIGGSPSSPAVASVGVQRTGSSLPLNTPRTVPAPQLAGGSPAPAVQPVSGVGSWPVAGSVADPGASRLPLGQPQAIGMPADRATPGGGDPGALGSLAPGPVQGSAQWSQANISGNPNPGALNGPPAAPAPTALPGQTGVNQVSPEANPNPGGL